MEKEQLDVKLARELGPSADGYDELDLPPEYCHYRDEGCEFGNSCLNCPFPRCIFELPGGKQHWLRRKRDREVVRLFTGEGRGMKELASMFGISQRTVQRILKGTKNERGFHS